MGITQEHITPDPADIAIIGLACRFPGGASDCQKFWELLSNKRCKMSTLARRSISYSYMLIRSSSGILPGP